MIKIVGYLIILIASAMIGFGVSEKYRNRTKELLAVRSSLEIIRNEINFNNRLIGDALLSGAGVKLPIISELFKTISDILAESNVTVSNAFLDCMSDFKESLSLNNDDINLLENFFSLAGTGSNVEEIKNINSVLSSIELNIKSATEDEMRYVKLFRTTGVLAGLMIGTIFI